MAVKYYCDRCTDECVKKWDYITIRQVGSPSNSWHLCMACLEAFRKWVRPFETHVAPTVVSMQPRATSVSSDEDPHLAE